MCWTKEHCQYEKEKDGHCLWNLAPKGISNDMRKIKYMEEAGGSSIPKSAAAWVGSAGSGHILCYQQFSDPGSQISQHCGGGGWVHSLQGFL